MTRALTVDVEDWYDGMAEIGHPVPRPDDARTGLDTLATLLANEGDGSRVTLFVVGKYAGQVRAALEELAEAGHELASHGPDHGTLPPSGAELEEWLRRGRETLEEQFQRPVKGFRSPRFDIPTGMELGEYRDCIARAGFEYVSDRHQLGSASPVWELPVLTRWRIPLGGGSYQRFLPRKSLVPMLASEGVTVLYYHSYDFGATLPSPSTSRSPAVLKQVVARARIPDIFTDLLRTGGSVSCHEATHRL